MTRLETILGSRNRVKVLRALFKRDGVCGRETARRADLSASAASVALGELVEAGVVFRNGTIGKGSYELNLDHFLMGQIARLFEDEAAAGQKMAETVRKHTNMLGAGVEFLGLGFDGNGIQLAIRPRPDPAAPEMRRLNASLKHQFGVEIAATHTEVSALIGLAGVRLASAGEKPRTRTGTAARDRTLDFFGLKKVNSPDAAMEKGK